MKKDIKEKDMTVKELATLMKQGFTKNQEEMAVMVKNAFQGNQKYIDKRFDTLTHEMGEGFKKTDEHFKQVTEKINNLSKNTVDVIHQEDFDKLTDRVDVVEEALDLKLKRA